MVSMSAGVVTEIIESSTNGPTHIDPINMTTSINYRTNQYTQPKGPSPAVRAMIKAKLLITIVVLKKDESGVVKTRPWFAPD